MVSAVPVVQASERGKAQNAPAVPGLEVHHQEEIQQDAATNHSTSSQVCPGNDTEAYAVQAADVPADNSEA